MPEPCQPKHCHLRGHNSPDPWPINGIQQEPNGACEYPRDNNMYVCMYGMGSGTGTGQEPPFRNAVPPPWLLHEQPPRGAGASPLKWCNLYGQSRNVCFSLHHHRSVSLRYPSRYIHKQDRHLLQVWHNSKVLISNPMPCGGMSNTQRWDIHHR